MFPHTNHLRKQNCCPADPEALLETTPPSSLPAPPTQPPSQVANVQVALTGAALPLIFGDGFRQRANVAEKGHLLRHQKVKSGAGFCPRRPTTPCDSCLLMWEELLGNGLMNIYIYLGNRTTILKWSKTAFKLEVAVSQESGRLLFSI